MVYLSYRLLKQLLEELYCHVVYGRLLVYVYVSA
jgi:hypothetical protein